MSRDRATRSFGRRLLRGSALTVLWLLVGVVVLLAASLQIARLPGGSERLRRLIVDQAASVVPGLRIGKISGDYTSWLAIEQIVLADRFGKPAIGVERVALRYDLSQLLGSKLVVEELRIVRPRVLVRPTDGGKLNLAELVVPTPPEPEQPSEPSSFTVSLRSLRIERGELALRLDPKAPLTVRELDVDLGAEAVGQDVKLSLRRLAALVLLPDNTALRAQLGATVGYAAGRLAAKLSLAAQEQAAKQPRAVGLELTADGTLERLQLALGLTLPGEGKVSVKGWAGLRGDRPHFDLQTQLTAVEPQRLLPQLMVPARVNLTLTTRGEGIPLQPDSTLSAALKLDDSQVNRIPIEALRLDAGLAGPRWTVKELVLRAGGTRVELEGSGTLEQVRAKVSVRLPTLARLPVPIKLPPLRGAVRLDAEVSGKLAGPLRAKVDLTADRVGLQKLGVHRLALKADVEGLPSAPRGHVDIEAERVDLGDPRLAIRSARIKARGRPRELTLSAEARGPKLDLGLDTRVLIAGRDITAELSRLRLAALGQKLTLSRPSTVRVLGGGKRIELDGLRVATLGGTLQVKGAFSRRGFPRLAAELELRELAAPGGAPPVSGKVTATVGKQRIDATVDLRTASHGALRASVALPVRYRAGAPFPQLSKRRALQAKLDLSRLALALAKRVSKELPPLDGRLSLTASVRGSLSQPTVDLGLRLAGGRYDQIGQLGASIDAVVRPDRVRFKGEISRAGRRQLAINAEVKEGLRPLLAGHVPDLARLREVPLYLGLELPSTPLAQLVLDPEDVEGVSGSLAAKLSVNGTVLRPRVGLWLKVAKLEHQGVKVRAVGAHVSARVDAGSSAASLELDVEGQRLLTAKGTLGIDLEGLIAGRPLAQVPLDATVEIPRYALARLGRYDAKLRQLAGVLDARVRLAGTLSTPTAKATLGLRRLKMGKTAIGDLDLRGAYDGKRVTAQVKLRQTGSTGKLYAEADLGLGKDGPLSAKVIGKALDLGVVPSLTPAIRDASGKLSFELSAGGTLARPRVKGRLRLRDAVLRPTGMSPMDQINVDVDVQPRRVTLSSLGLRSGGGKLTARGALQLSSEMKPRAFDLAAQAKGFRIDVGAVSKAIFSGRIGVDGKVDGKVLAVHAKLTDGALKMPEIQSQPDLQAVGPLPDVVFVDPRGVRKRRREQQGKGPMAAPLQLRLTADTKELFVRSEELDLELYTKLKATTDDKQRVRLAGEVGIRRGKIKLLSNWFEVRRAVMSFNGALNPDPALNVELSRKFADTEIFVGLQGTARKPELVLRSDPPVYDRSQIVSLIITGRLDPRAADSGDDDQLRTAASALTQLALGGLFRRVAPAVGVDVARVNLGEAENKETGEKEVRAEAELGKYLTERLYLGYRRVFGASTDENANEAMLEYRISARWLLMALFGDAGVGGLDLLWTYRY